MARLLGIEWDNHEVRFVVANPRTGGLTVEEAFRVELASGVQGFDAVRTSIGAALAERKLESLDTLVAVARGSVELKQLSLPPAPDDELPEMVRFQALRELHSFGETWPLDFLPLNDAPDQPRNVLAATIAPELVDNIRETCVPAQLKLERILVRPCAAAALLLRSGDLGSESVRLLIDPLSDEVDLTVLDGQKVVFLRTARLSAGSLESPDNVRPLVGELRRTMAAAVNQLGGKQVEALYFCGSAAQHGAVAERLGTELGLPVRVFEPFGQVALGRGMRSELPENAERYAALLGMLVDEAEGRKPGIDFLHPRQKPEAPSRRRPAILAGATAGLVAASIAGMIWFSLHNKDAEIASLQAQLKAAEPAVAKSNELIAKADAIDAWQGSEVVWLDELRELSLDLPSAEDVMFTKLLMKKAAAGDYGEIAMEGLARVPSVVPSLEQTLRDDHHDVNGSRGSSDDKQSRYKWSFKPVLIVKPGQTKEGYVDRTSPPSDEDRTANRAEDQDQEEKPSEEQPTAQTAGRNEEIR